MSHFLSILLEHRASTKMFYKCWILYVARVEKLDKWLNLHSKFQKIVDELLTEGMLVQVRGKYELNLANYNNSEYATMLGEKEVMSFVTLVYEYKRLWKNRKGISSNNQSYRLLDDERTKPALATFVKKYKEVDYETIIKATEEYLNGLDKDEHGNLLFAVKSTTFITGNKNRDYLIEYCKMMDNRHKMQTNLKATNKYQQHGSTWQDV